MTYNTLSDAVTMPQGEETLLAGRYRIVLQLGRGGMGSVWLVEDAQLDNKQFAIKMLPSILVSNKRAYRQLKDEALVAMRLVHPNIVQLRAFEENGGNPFLVMDYIDGETLDEYLADREGLPESEVLRLLRPIAAALDYAHGEGVVHRDVKPANVMIRKDGHPFILDFGIAREIQETMTRVTGKLSSGTLLYMSPEQLHGASPKKEQDIYSFAAMAYECLKGEPPFSRGQIEYQIDNDMPEPLPNSSPETGEEAAGRRGMAIASSVMSGLSKKPEGRPPTCAAVLSGNVSSGDNTPPPLRGTSPKLGEEFDGIDAMELPFKFSAAGTAGDDPLTDDDRRALESVVRKLASRGGLPAWVDDTSLYGLSQRAAAETLDRVARLWVRGSCRRGGGYKRLFTENESARWSVLARSGRIATRVMTSIYEFVRDDVALSGGRRGGGVA